MKKVEGKMDGDEGEQEVLHNGETRKQRAK